MADLGELLGTLLTSIAHARRIADEESAAIAEYYKDHPLLETMAVPRVRLPEVEIDIPVLIESYDASDATVYEEPEKIRAEVLDQFDEIVAKENVRLPDSFKEQFQSQLVRELKALQAAPADSTRRASSEAVMRASDVAFTSAVRRLSADDRAQITRDQEKLVREVIRARSRAVSLQKTGRPPSINASIITAEVKEKADDKNVTRLRLVMKEEGMEWSIGQNDRGETRGTLVPE